MNQRSHVRLFQDLASDLQELQRQRVFQGFLVLPDIAHILEGSHEPVRRALMESELRSDP